jgi:hypothetical protein
MPKGKPLANMMEHEVVEVLYTCVKNAKVEFEDVAKQLGLKDAATAFVFTQGCEINITNTS